MDEVTSLALGGIIGIALVVSYKVYSTVSGIVQDTGAVVKYIKSNIVGSGKNTDVNSNNTL